MFVSNVSGLPNLFYEFCFTVCVSYLRSCRSEPPFFELPLLLLDRSYDLAAVNLGMLPADKLATAEPQRLIDHEDADNPWTALAQASKDSLALVGADMLRQLRPVGAAAAPKHA